jgi:hypothetical protein
MLRQALKARVQPRPDQAIRLGVLARWLARYTDADGKEWIAERQKAHNEERLAAAVGDLLAWSRESGKPLPAAVRIPDEEVDDL